MNIWSRLGEDNRESFLEDLNNIPHDTMDSVIVTPHSYITTLNSKGFRGVKNPLKI